MFPWLIISLWPLTTLSMFRFFWFSSGLLFVFGLFKHNSNWSIHLLISKHIYLFFLMIYLLKILVRLSCRISYITDFSECISVMSFNMFFYPWYFLKSCRFFTYSNSFFFNLTYISKLLSLRGTRFSIFYFDVKSDN